MRPILVLTLTAALAGCVTSPRPEPAVIPPADVGMAGSPAPAAAGGKRIVSDGRGSFILPDGTRVRAEAGGGFTLPNGASVAPDGTSGITLPNGSRCASDGAGGYLCP